MPVSAPTAGSAALATTKANSETTELYVVHPFRLIGVGKAANVGMSDQVGPGDNDLDMARQTYVERVQHCNVGWCQDLLQVASLGLVDEATELLVERAAIGPVVTGCKHVDQKGCTSKGTGSYRFRGFTPDGEAGGNQPSNNQLSGMRTGLNKMLLLPLDDVKRRMIVFPSFPTARWNVRFKLHAPLNTTIEASCQDGSLEYRLLRVTLSGSWID
jgi:hypothetical protein